ncbi:MAG: ABC transporter permease [Bacteroidales bacterium]|nr:ABC transporter permease [Bacteroidales bacterium]
MKLFYHFGRYFILMGKVFSKPEKGRIYYKEIVKEIDKIGINSIGIVIIISVFMGAVLTLQVRYNFDSPIIPLYLIGLSVRDTMFLEFSSTIVGLILAGKVGSNISSEIGTMRITEQIDALEIMGVNSAGFLILPKIIAAVIINPFLTVISMFVGILGGWLAVIATGALSPADYIYGLHYWFIPFYIAYSLIKTVVFAIIITSVPAYHGYYVNGGALEVGRASTRGVVFSCILILGSDYVLTQLILS